MNQSDDLTGTLVLVHPELSEDPVNKQGQMGMIMFAEPEKDDIYVTFGKNERALYSSDALLVFKKPGEIYKGLMTDTKNLSIPDFKALHRIGMLLDNGTSKGAKDAMQLAMENPGVHSRAMETLQSKLGLDVHIVAEQEQLNTQSYGR
ncbi:hypothetical protein [Mucilaginibacter polytrichastri]|uniref:Uncharacterized protein n=1 Tax=Mucilaginibacter polytrichastri TaxID=1302689 RepID=A0A1Q6A469_9SPHI|nr:hypothetical protein [Mucilaginibacter polytrichastri]OKS88805.1 hypothetical protein RG47T_4283 [Mucilaginibacter polytrichastri]SFT05907.1 hypothetical protein SAMN04487890_109137 [Mucilaginibacter polytrichastri]